MSILRITLVGTGRAAGALAASLQTECTELVAVMGRKPERARDIAARASQATRGAQGDARTGHMRDHPGQPVGLSLRDAPPPTDWWMLAVSDDAIAAVDSDLAASGAYRGAKLVTHLSGALTSATLEAGRRAGLAVASLHPLMPFAAPSPGPDATASGKAGRDAQPSGDRATMALSGRFFTLEGDDRAEAWIAPWVSAVGAEYARIPAETKALYHAAAVMAAPYVVTLLAAATSAAAKAGLPQEKGRSALAGLAAAALGNAARLGPQQALTGPIPRGDVGTVHAHIEQLSAHLPNMLSLYARLGLETLRLAQASSSPPAPDVVREIETALQAALLQSRAPATPQRGTLPSREVGGESR